MQQIMGTDVSEDQKMEHTIAALLYNYIKSRGWVIQPSSNQTKSKKW